MASLNSIAPRRENVGLGMSEMGLSCELRFGDALKAVLRFRLVVALYDEGVGGTSDRLESFEDRLDDLDRIERGRAGSPLGRGVKNAADPRRDSLAEGARASMPFSDREPSSCSACTESARRPVPFLPSSSSRLAVASLYRPLLSIHQFPPTIRAT
jgi:hypothetical protein